MRFALPTLAALLLSSCVTPGGSARDSLGDLQALEAQGGWAELSEHLTDVPPSQRDAAWEKVAEACGVGLLAEANNDADPLAHIALADQLGRRFPSLKRSERFLTARAEAGVADLQACRGVNGCRHSDNDWTERVFRFAQTDPAHIAVRAAVMLQNHLIAEVAVPFYRLALDEKAGAPLCQDAGLQKSVLAALESNNWNVDSARQVASVLCFDALKAPLLAELAQAKDSELLKTSCDFLSQKGALDKAQAERCAPFAAYQEKNRTTSATFTVEPQR